MTRTTNRERWQEASAAEPCPVCGAKKWCRVSADRQHCNCRHEAKGAVKVGKYKDGSEYFTHKLIDDGPQPNRRARRRTTRPATAKPRDGSRSSAPATGSHDAKPVTDNGAAEGLSESETSTRDKAYRLLLAESPLSAEHRENLKRRGLSDAAVDAGGYGTWSSDPSAQMYTAYKLFRALGNDVFVRIPGFGPGCTKIHAVTGLLIPIRDVAGRIIALQIRRDDKSDGSSRYVWLSSRSAQNPDGPSPGSPPHVPQGIRGSIDRVRITEGPLKADIAYRLSGTPTIGFAGVSTWRRVLPILQALGVKTILLAFDTDAWANKNVARCLRECFLGLEEAGYDD